MLWLLKTGVIWVMPEDKKVIYKLQNKPKKKKTCCSLNLQSPICDLKNLNKLCENALYLPTIHDWNVSFVSNEC